MKNIQGQSLFEVLIALAVVGFILVGLIQAATLSIRNTTLTKNKAQANSYASQLSEWLRGERDTKWTDFWGRLNTYKTYCFDSATPSWGNVDDCAATEMIPGTIFTRAAVFRCYTGTSSFTYDPNCIDTAVSMVQATITVSWIDGGLTHSVDVVTNLTNSKSP